MFKLREVYRHAGGGVLVSLVPGIARPDRAPSFRSEGVGHVRVDDLVPVAVEIHDGAWDSPSRSRRPRPGCRRADVPVGTNSLRIVGRDVRAEVGRVVAADAAVNSPLVVDVVIDAVGEVVVVVGFGVALL